VLRDLEALLERTAEHLGQADAQQQREQRG
jgi:hypothetical protein